MNIVTHNLSAMNANRQLKMTTSRAQKTAEKLSSGYKINRAADDAAGLSISEKMRSQIRGLNRGADNLQDGISFVQVADGALNEVQNILQRINELSVQAANGTNSASDRKALDQEVQSLKVEMERIFVSTTFNDRQIWPDESIDNAPTQIGTTPVQALKVTTPSSQRFDLTNDNFNKIAKSSYLINANTQGVYLSWDDYDGFHHVTQTISWNDLKQQNYSFHVADYFDPNETSSLLDTNGYPVFDFEISFSVADCATVDDMITAINNTSMSSSTYTYGELRFEDTSGNAVNPDHFGSSASVTLSSYVMYASRTNANSGFDYDQASDSFATADAITANGGNMTSTWSIQDVNTARSSTDTWSFSFEIEGIGNVVATSCDVRYRSYDTSPTTKDVWWYYDTNSKGEIIQRAHTHYSRAHGMGTLGSVMDCLTGPNDTTTTTDTPGLLDYVGTDRPGGNITLEFEIKSTENYSGKISDDVGSFNLTIYVDGTESEKEVLDRINNALNGNTILDLYTDDGDYTTARTYVYKSTEQKSDADQPVYEDHFSFNSVDLNIHAGPTTTDRLNIRYRCLRVEALNLHNTNVLTEDNATNAIKQVHNALILVNKERSNFGAYQNRMEHSLAANQNTSENTCAAESRIRDTDMAEEIVKNSKENILLQVSQSMLAQSNNAPQGVLTLLK